MPHTWDGELTATADDGSAAWGFTLGLYELDDPGYGNSSIAASYCGASVSIAFYDNYAPPDPEWPGATAPGGWPQGAQDAWNTWANETAPESKTVNGCVYALTASAPGGSVVDVAYICVGWDIVEGDPMDVAVWRGATYIEQPGGFTISNLVMKGRLGTDQKTNRYEIRSWHDRRAQYILCADEQTQITAFIGTASVVFDYDFPEGEDPDGNPLPTSVVVGGNSSQLTIGFACANLAAVDTDYCKASGFTWGGQTVPLTNVNFWSSDGSTWTASTTNPGSAHLRIYNVSNGITMRRIGAGTATATGSATAQILGPIRYNISAKGFAPDSGFDPETADPTFYTGLNIYTSETEYEPVYLAPGLSAYYQQVWWYNGTVTNRIKTGEWYFDFDFQGSKANPDWLEEAYENLDSGDGQSNAYGKVVLPSIENVLDSTTPHWAGAVSCAWAEISADIPPGKSSRPTEWDGDGVAIQLPADIWTVGGSGGTVTRELATRWPARYAYMAAGPTTWNEPDFCIWNRANVIADVDDLPAAVTAAPTEDVFNYDNSSWGRLVFSAWPGTTEGETVTLTLDYALTDVTRTGPNTWTVSTTTNSVTTEGALTAAGIVLFDFASLVRANDINLQQVTNVTFAFSASMAGEYTFADWRLVPDPTVGSDPVLLPHVSLGDWKFLSRYSAFGATASGVSCLNLTYGYEGYDGAERGMKGTVYVPDGWDYLKDLERLVAELNWQEQLTSSYGTAAVAAAMVDGESKIIGDGPFWHDLQRGDGDELTGYAGIACRNFVAVPYGTGPVPVTVNAFWTGGGRAHGIKLADGVRVRGTGASDYTVENSIIIYRREAGVPGEWEEYASCEPDEYGRWKTPPLAEGTPEGFWAYKVDDDEVAIVTRQYSLGLVEIVVAYAPHLTSHPLHGAVHLVYISGSGRPCYQQANPDLAGWRYGGNAPVESQLLGKAITTTGGYRKPSIVLLWDGGLMVSATGSNGVDNWVSFDMGKTWAAV